MDYPRSMESIDQRKRRRTTYFKKMRFKDQIHTFKSRCQQHQI